MSFSHNIIVKGLHYFKVLIQFHILFLIYYFNNYFISNYVYMYTFEYVHVRAGTFRLLFFGN